MEAVKLIIELSINYGNIEYFQKYFEGLFIQSLEDPACEIRYYCNTSLIVRGSCSYVIFARN